MTSNKCSYFNCKKSKKHDTDVQFHVFPKDTERSTIWLENCGNIKLCGLSSEQLRRHYVCSRHFIRSMYMNLNVKKRRLIQCAVPIKCTEHFNVESSQTTIKSEPLIDTVEDSIMNSVTEDDNLAELSQTTIKSEPLIDIVEDSIMNSVTEDDNLAELSPTTIKSEPLIDIIEDSIMNSVTKDENLAELSQTTIKSEPLIDIIEDSIMNSVTKDENLDLSQLLKRELLFDIVEDSNKDSVTEDDNLDINPNMMSTSSDVFKVLIPQRKYLPASTDILVHKNAALTLFKSSQSPTPQTQELSTLPSFDKNNVISLNDIPSLTIQLKNEKLENRCTKLQRLLIRKKSTISSLKKEYDKLLIKKKTDPQEFLGCFKFHSATSKLLVSMQIKHKLHRPWTREEKMFSLSLYKKSPSYYEYMIQNKIILPSLKAIHQWLILSADFET